MKHLLHLFVALVLVGCVHRDSARPDVAHVSAIVGDATAHSKKSREAIDKASGLLGKASVQVVEIKEQAPDTLKPKVAALETTVKAAREELANAKSEAIEAETKLLEASAQTRILRDQVNAQADELEKLRPIAADRDKQRALAWKWRIYFWGLIASIALFYAGKAYLKTLWPL